MLLFELPKSFSGTVKNHRYVLFGSTAGKKEKKTPLYYPRRALFERHD